jgi:hypothetical protein
MSDNGRAPGRMLDTLLPFPDAAYSAFCPIVVEASCVRNLNWLWWHAGTQAQKWHRRRTGGASGEWRGADRRFNREVRSRDPHDHQKLEGKDVFDLQLKPCPMLHADLAMWSLLRQSGQETLFNFVSGIETQPIVKEPGVKLVYDIEPDNFKLD